MGVVGQRHAPVSLNPGKLLGIHETEGRAGLGPDRYGHGKLAPPNQSSNHGPSSPQLVALPTTILQPLCKLRYFFINTGVPGVKDTILGLNSRADYEPKISYTPPPHGAIARGGPWPPLQCASKPLDSLLCLSIHLNPSSSGPWTRHPAISFLVFLFVLLHTAFRTTSFFGIAVSCILSM